MSEEENISKQTHNLILNNAIWYTRIDVAISDAMFEAEKMGKDKQRFIDPLLEARRICGLALQVTEPPKPQEES